MSPNKKRVSNERLLELIQEHETYDKVGAILGIKPQTVKYYCVQAGITTRNRTDVLTSQRVAALLGLPVKRLDVLVLRYGFPFRQTVSTIRVFDAKAVELWLYHRQNWHLYDLNAITDKAMRGRLWRGRFGLSPYVRQVAFAKAVGCAPSCITRLALRAGLPFILIRGMRYFAPEHVERYRKHVGVFLGKPLKRWSDEELAYLRTHWDVLTTREIAERLGR